MTERLNWTELNHLKRPWCWEKLRAGEGDDRGWDGWVASLTWWTWVWVDSGSWWWTGRPGVLQFMGSQRVGHDWATELNWIFHCIPVPHLLYPLICWRTFRLFLSRRTNTLSWSLWHDQVAPFLLYLEQRITEGSIQREDTAHWDVLTSCEIQQEVTNNLLLIIFKVQKFANALLLEIIK